MKKRAPTQSSSRATLPERESTPAGSSAAAGVSGYAAGSSPLLQAVDRWLADRKAQGWSAWTLGDRQNMRRFALWLENEEETPATLDALAPARILAFLAQLRDPCPTGRFGSADPGAKRAAQPSTVHTY